ncbi:MAG: glycosyl transferase family 2 [Bacteroidota bacterium]|nr:glycosyl transferase family 2 [Bacteroidota bacterium]
MQFPKISIVTVSLNGARYLEECICSILEQDYPALEYIIVDGGSTDGSMDIIRKYADKISLVISEPDKGPGEALNKGFAKATGDIMGWLNTDDRLHPKSLFAVAEIFNSFQNVDWMMGFPSWFSATGLCVNEIYYNRDKLYYSPSYINDNLHLKFARWSKWRFAMGDFSAIQQESVFWRKSLWDKTGGCVKEGLIAYDLELWTRFFEHAQLYTCNVLVGGFRIHGNQISFNQHQRYTNESRTFINTFREKMFDHNFEYRLRINLARAAKPFYYYNIPGLKNIYPRLLNLPPYIIYDFMEGKFAIAQD